MSLLNAAERFASIDCSQITLDIKRCLHAQDRYSDCAACFKVCPVQAITVGKPPSFNTELCQSCLACLPACPTGAYRADDDVASLLNCTTHIEEQPVELLCGLHPHPQTGLNTESIGIQVQACLAGLGTGAYLALYTLGITRIFPRTDACRECKWRSLHPEIHRQADRANLFLAAWGKDSTVTCLEQLASPGDRPLWDAKNPPLSRRDLFRMMARQGQVVMARAMENGVTTSERKPGRDRSRLLAAVSHLPYLQAVTLSADLADFDFASLTISDSCTACGACGRTCPTEALHFEQNDDVMSFSISFSTQNCIGCDLCDHVCLPDAITINHAPAVEQVLGATEPVIVHSGLMFRCERCKTLVAKRGDAKYCSLCEYRRTHPFGSMMPKKVLKEAHL